MDVDFAVANAWLTLGLKGAGILLLIVFAMVGVRIFGILGSVNTLLATVQDVADMVQSFLWQPVRFYSNVVKRIRDLIGR